MSVMKLGEAPASAAHRDAMPRPRERVVVGTMHRELQALASGIAVAVGACSAPANRAAPASPTAPSCPTDRAVVLASRADIARVAGCTTLAGVVIRSGAALDASALHALATIRGDLVVGPTVGIAEVSFRELRVIGGALRVHDNGLLQGLFFPRLERAGAIDVDGNVALTTLSLPRLGSVGGPLHVTANPSLEIIDMSVLESVAQELVIAGAPQLTLIDAPQLREAAAVQLEAPRLAPELADRLRATPAP
jgi:hypothetical protein